jgi:hypothetical protein
MTPYGDIPDKDRRIISEILLLQAWLNDRKSVLPPLTVAKAMVCLAHDWYEVHMEEEGDKLLKKAEELCPGYFMAPILVQMKNDSEFCLLVCQLRDTLGWELILSFGFDNEQV